MLGWPHEAHKFVPRADNYSIHSSSKFPNRTIKGWCLWAQVMWQVYLMEEPDINYGTKPCGGCYSAVSQGIYSEPAFIVMTGSPLFVNKINIRWSMNKQPQFSWGGMYLCKVLSRWHIVLELYREWKLNYIYLAFKSWFMSRTDLYLNWFNSCGILRVCMLNQIFLILGYSMIYLIH